MEWLYWAVPEAALITVFAFAAWEGNASGGFGSLLTLLIIGCCAAAFVMSGWLIGVASIVGGFTYVFVLKSLFQPQQP